MRVSGWSRESEFLTILLTCCVENSDTRVADFSVRLVNPLILRRIVVEQQSIPCRLF